MSMTPLRHLREMRGDSVALTVLRGDARQELLIDGKALCADPLSRFHRFDERLARNELPLNLAATAGQIGLTARADAASGYALARELEYVSSVVALEPLQDLTGSLAFPMAIDQPQPFQTSYTWKDVKWTKGGRVSHNYRDIGTRGDINVAKNTAQPIYPTIAHASWGLDDIARAALGGIPLPALEMQGAVRTVAEDVNTQIWYGDATLGIAGIYGATGITPAVVANGSGGSPLWANKTADEMEKDITDMIVDYMAATTGLGFLAPNRIALPTSIYFKAATTTRSQYNNVTVLQFIEQALAACGGGNPMVTVHPELENNGSGAKWMQLYRYDSAVAGRMMPIGPTFLQPDIEATLVTQAIHAQSGGLIIRYPVAFQQRFGM